MRRLFTLMLCIFSISAQASSINIQNEDESSNKKQNATIVHFAIEAASGSMTADPHQPGQYLLILNNVNEVVIFVNNSPLTTKGTMSLAYFVNRWDTEVNKKLFTPNFIISYTKGKLGVRDADAFILTNPEYDTKTSKLTFTATPLGSNGNKTISGKLFNITLTHASTISCGKLGVWGNLIKNEPFEKKCK